MPGTGVVNAAKPNACSHRETASVRKEIWNGRIGDCEGIKGIRDWHTDIEGTKGYVSAWNLKWIGCKRHGCYGRIEKRARIFEVGKYRQVLVAQIARERTIETLAICGGSAGVKAAKLKRK